MLYDCLKEIEEEKLAKILHEELGYLPSLAKSIASKLKQHPYLCEQEFKSYVGKACHKIKELCADLKMKEQVN